MADAELPKTQCTNGVFALLHHRERFSRNRAAVFNARRQASGSRLIPDAQTSLMSQGADFILGKSGVEQRRNYMMVGRSFLSRDGSRPGHLD